VRGEQSVDLASVSDPVLVREDGTYLYTLPSVVDDAALGVTHVIRGEDHVVNTGVQIQIFRALGAEEPVFGHHNLLTTIEGDGLSKRTGALSLRSLREAGQEPMAVASLATLIGSSDKVTAMPTMAALAATVDLGHLSRAPAKFDPGDLDALTAQLVHAMPYDSVKDRLAALGIGGGEAFWTAVRGNCTKIPDAAQWWAVIEGPIAPTTEDDAFVAAAKAALPDEPWNDTTWSTWTKAVQQATGRKGKDLFMPLRRILTGLEHGPELKMLLPLIGRERALQRLG
jgi:glutamyl-tRNA synthetase